MAGPVPGLSSRERRFRAAELAEGSEQAARVFIRAGNFFSPWPDGTSRERRLKAPESRGNGRFCGPRFSQGGKRFFKSVAGQDRSTLPLRSVLGVCHWQTAPEAAAETAALSPAPALYQERPHLKQKNEHLKKKARKHAAFTRCSHEHLRKGAGS